MMEVLRCERLRKTFGGVVALADVSLIFPGSGITAVIGPNGAGKTTLFNVLTGFTAPDSGNCFLGHNRLTGCAPHRIARMGLVRTFQETRLMWSASVIENVLLALAQRGEGLLKAVTRWGLAKEESRQRQRAMEFLESVGIADLASKRAIDLSFGQQRLLTIACCLSVEAHVLLLDEPVAGLSSAMITRIEGILFENARARSIVFIEHDMSAVRRISNHLVVLDHGRVVAEGIPEDILGQRQILEIYLG